MAHLKIIGTRIALALLLFSTVFLFQNCGRGFLLENALEIASESSDSNGAIVPTCSPTQSQVCESGNGFGIQFCQIDGTPLDCDLESCNPGFILQDRSCIPLACTPNSTTACVGLNGTGNQTCNLSGTEFQPCELNACNPGYNLSDGTCVVNSCEPNVASVCLQNNGTGMHTCNATGTAFGPCQLTSCNSGYNLQNGNCVANACTPGSTMSCSENNGTGSRTCNSTGTGFGACEFNMCNSGYNLQNGLCIANACTPNMVSACMQNNGTGTHTCNSQGTGYTACLLTSCNSGYTLQSGICLVTPPEPPPGPSPNGIIWAVGVCGHVEKSTDNGVTFQSVDSITTVTGRRLVLQNFTQCNDGDHGQPALYGLAYGNGRLLLASWNIDPNALGPATTNEIRLYSDDKGTTWREFSSVSSINLGQAFWDLSFSKTGGYFIGSTHYGDIRMMKSPDGLNWTAVVSQCTMDPLCKFRNSAAAGNYFVVGGDGSNFFSGNVNNGPASQANNGNSRSISSGSRRSASTDDFGVVAGEDSSYLAVVDGRTGYSGSINIGQTVSSGIFSANNEIFVSTSNSIYRVDISCMAQNSCTGSSVRVAGINYRMGRMWYLNGYLYGVRYWSESDGQIYRSNTSFDPNTSAVTNISFQPVSTSARNIPRSAEIKKMVYIPQ